MEAEDLVGLGYLYISWTKIYKYALNNFLIHGNRRLSWLVLNSLLMHGSRRLSWLVLNSLLMHGSRRFNWA